MQTIEKGKNIMKYFLLLFVTNLILSLSSVFAQEVAPLRLGNIWIYNEYPSVSRTTVVDSNAIIDTISYCKLFIEYNYGGLHYFLYMRLKQNGYYAFRRDTSYPAPNNEQIYWKNNGVIGDSWENPAPYFPLIYTVLDTFVAPVFGSPHTLKHLEIDGSLVLFDEYWTEEFGKMSRTDFGTPISSLQGCVIDGVVYGDTSFNVVSVENENDQPESFALQQNYPNPFNSVTHIRYSIPQSGNVSFKVFDILGNEVAVLVDKYQSSGSYNVVFEGDDLSSGIYFYQLTSDNYSATKKLMLLK